MKHIFATGALALLSTNTIAMEALPYQIECTAKKGFETSLKRLVDGRPEAGMEIFSVDSSPYNTTIWRMVDGEYRWISMEDKDKRTEELTSMEIGIRIAHKTVADEPNNAYYWTRYPSLQLTSGGLTSDKWVIRFADRKFLNTKQDHTAIWVKEGRCIFRGKPD